jgi:hypothetical protein
MKFQMYLRRSFLLALGAVLVQAPICALAQPGSPGPMAMRENGAGFDWIEHTQQTLGELKGKLNLAPGQLAAWENWSGGVLHDAHQQLEQDKARQPQAVAPETAESETTPERMARGIERLRAQTKWMQEHLAQLEAAQGRTKTFYAQLDTNQKTIFDLFWHKVHHRAAAAEDDCEMCER